MTIGFTRRTCYPISVPRLVSGDPKRWIAASIPRFEHTNLSDPTRDDSSAVGWITHLGFQAITAPNGSLGQQEMSPNVAERVPTTETENSVGRSGRDQAFHLIRQA